MTDLGVALGLSHVTAAIFGPVLLAAKTKRQGFSGARHTRRVGFQDLRAKRTEADTFIEKGRDYLTTFLGNSWSASWDQIGFTNGSLTLPNTDAMRLHVLECLMGWFSANPDRELTADGVTLTAAHAEELRDALTEAVDTVAGSKEVARTKRDERGLAEAALEKKLNCLYRELEAVLDPKDPRWLKFIDRIPGDPRVPEAVKQVTATAQPGGVIVIDWPDTARAARYKVLKQVAGVDAAPVLAVTVDDSDAQLTGVPDGSSVKLQIVATNAVGDAPASPVIELEVA